MLNSIQGKAQALLSHHPILYTILTFFSYSRLQAPSVQHQALPRHLRPLQAAQHQVEPASEQEAQGGESHTWSAQTNR